MKTWLTGHKRRLFTLGIAAAAIAAFALGWRAGATAAERNLYAALWTADRPDPDRCALCGGRVRYHAPCLLDASSGQLGEMQVYAPHPSRQGELAPMAEQPTGTFRFQPCAGLMGTRDTSTHTFQVILPEERKLPDPALFCKACRRLLAGAGAEGYAVVDLYDLDHVQAYPLRNEVIRDYRVSVSDRNDGPVDVCVTGLLGR